MPKSADQLSESDFTCPIVGGSCRRGCPGAEQAIDRLRERAVAERLTGVPTPPTDKQKQEELQRAVWGKRPIGSRGRGLGEKCGKSPKKVQ